MTTERMVGNLQFSVVQMGARLHYAAPAALQQAGLLTSLYTDSHQDSTAVRSLRLLPRKMQPGGIRRLLSRKIPSAIPASKVRAWSWPSFQVELFRRMHPRHRNNARYWYQHCVGGHWLGKKAIKENFLGANALYVHPGTCTDAIQAAKRRGLFIALEAISHPMNKFVEKAEYEKFGLPAPEAETELIDNINFFRNEADLADVILAASPYVRDGLIELGLDPAKIQVVPYGLDGSSFNEPPAPVSGRALYVGNIGYLKGVPYLAEAARALKARGFSGEIRAVGPINPQLAIRPEFAGPNYVGQVPRSEVRQEFLTADVFVFPSLSDGFGIVLLEAMSAGLPVICTSNCAALVRHGENGLIVPLRDPHAIAAAIEQIVGDRDLRNRMSIAAKATAAEYDLNSYGRRLVQGIAGSEDALSGS